MHNPYLGRKVALFSCAAYRNCEEITVSGLWEIEEYLMRDPAAYIQSPGFLLCRPEDESMDDAIFVDEWDLIAQIDPAEYAKMLFNEREMEWCAEEMEKMCA